VLGAEKRWRTHFMLNILEIKSIIFAHNFAKKILENQAKEKEFTGVAQLVQWRQNPGIS